MTREVMHALARAEARLSAIQSRIKILKKKENEVLEAQKERIVAQLNQALALHFTPTLIRLRVRTGYTQDSILERLIALVDGESDPITVLGQLMFSKDLEDLVTKVQQGAPLAKPQEIQHSELVSRFTKTFYDLSSTQIAKPDKSMELPPLRDEIEELTKELTELSLRIAELSKNSDKAQASLVSSSQPKEESGLHASSDAGDVRDLLQGDLLQMLGLGPHAESIIEELLSERAAELLLMHRLVVSASRATQDRVCVLCGLDVNRCACDLRQRFEAVLSSVFDISKEEWEVLVARYWLNFYPYFYSTWEKTVDSLIGAIPESAINPTRAAFEFLQRMILGDKLNGIWFASEIYKASSMGAERMQLNQWLKMNLNESLPGFARRVSTQYPALMSDENLAIAWLLRITNGGTEFPDELLDLS